MRIALTALLAATFYLSEIPSHFKISAILETTFSQCAMWLVTFHFPFSSLNKDLTPSAATADTYYSLPQGKRPPSCMPLWGTWTQGGEASLQSVIAATRASVFISGGCISGEVDLSNDCILNSPVDECACGLIGYKVQFRWDGATLCVSVCFVCISSTEEHLECNGKR